jgi:[ribosomal protein S18]-alanine N-acetyltransferase
MLKLRSVRVEDLDALFVLDQQCFPEGIAYSREELTYFLFETISLSLIAEEDRKLAGFVVAEQVSSTLMHLITIDVAAGMRRLGVGRLLMEAILEGAVCTGAKAIELEVAVDNDAAQAFYREAGFVETGRIAGYYLGTLDALTMRRTLLV